MNYLGIDVHAAASVWCLLDPQGQQIDSGKVATTSQDLMRLVERLSARDEILVGQEVGGMTYLVHDAVTDAGARVLSFNAHHLRMIASSRKKTDRRDAYWIAKALQSGMMP
ncbi:MAG: transposase, partial [Deltaproteobacteria bacterium]|nr:transposase [Deltaproteobacteria bacterium]